MKIGKGLKRVGEYSVGVIKRTRGDPLKLYYAIVVITLKLRPKGS
ncbi:hypothetical protein OROHE_015490 [Orobanche hederae]